MASNDEGDGYRRDVLIAYGVQTAADSDFIDPSTGLVDPATGKHVTNAVANRAPLNLTLAAVHMRHVPASGNSSGVFGSGAVGSAAFTRADCYLTRAVPPIDGGGGGKYEDDWSAYPWTEYPGGLTVGLIDFYEAELYSASYAGRGIPHPSGQELFRFYQAYTIAKDTQYRVGPAGGRRLSVSLSSVEVSVAAAVVFGVIVTTLVAVAV